MQRYDHKFAAAVSSSTSLQAANTKGQLGSFLKHGDHVISPLRFIVSVGYWYTLERYTLEPNGNKDVRVQVMMRRTEYGN